MRPSAATAASSVVTRLVAETEAVRCSSRSSIHLTRRAQPHAVAWHLQRTGNHGVDRKRSLEIRGDVIGVLTGIVFRDDAVGFDRRAGIAWIVDADGDAVGGGRKRGLRVTIAKAALVDEVGAERRMQHRGFRSKRLLRIDDGRQRLVVDLDQVQRIFGDIAVFGNDKRDGFPDIAHPVAGDRPAFDIGLDADRHAAGEPCHILAGQYGEDAGQRPGGSRNDCTDSGMAVWRTQDRQVRGITTDGQVVDVAAAAGQKSGVLDTFDGATDQAARRFQSRHSLLPHPSIEGCLGERVEEQARSDDTDAYQTLPRSLKILSREPADAAENAGRGAGMIVEEPRKMRRHRKASRSAISPGDAFMSPTALRMRKSSMGRDASSRIECGTERQSAKRSMTAIISSPRSTSCTSALLGSCTMASASVRARQRMSGVMEPTLEAKKSGA